MARVLAIAALVAVGLFYADRFLTANSENAFQSEVRANIKVAQKSQLAFFNEYNRYAETAEEMGFTSEHSLLYFYFSEKELPIYLKHNLEKKDWPYATNDDYQFVIEVRRRSGANPEILIQPKNGPLRGLEKK